ncbi:MAG: type II toxin-antitoxin system VapC family toxin [Campylobacterales bacterium]|nr:type II toxin-antitoxin system VapC family toxin [Campylobacterales bacterium]
MIKYLIDSNIIIYYLNGNQTVYEFIHQYKEFSALSIITYYEVLNYDFSQDEEQIVKEFLESFKTINLSQNMISKALENRKIKKIKMADNFILSAAQLLNLKLITHNIKDFQPFDTEILSILP